MYRHQQARPFTTPTRDGDIYRQSYARRSRRQSPLPSNPIPSLIDLTEDDADVLIVGVSSSKQTDRPNHGTPMHRSTSQQQVNMPVWDSDDEYKDPVTSYDVLGESVSLLASLKRSLSPAPLNDVIDCDEFGDECDSSLPLSLPDWRTSLSSDETNDPASPRPETPRQAGPVDVLNETMEIEDLEPLSHGGTFDLSLPTAESNIRDVATDAFESWTAEESRIAALCLTPEARDAFFRALDKSIEKWRRHTKRESYVPRDLSSIPSFATTPSNPKLRRKRLLH